MALVVKKFGGTSVADPARMRAVAEHVAAARTGGDDVVVVVSAMGKTTDDLERLASRVAAAPDPRELDMLLTAGERISMAVLCMAIRELGVPATSFTGSQAGIVTDTDHGRAKILEVKGDRIREAIAAGHIAVVAGFQGVSTAKDVTTLGRGGSDTTAVALAAALGASCCEIYTDVAGVYTADPRVVADARPLAELSFEEMLEMSATGCPKPEMRSVQFARNHDVTLHVRSAFTWEPGTWVRKEPTMEQAIISAVTHDTSEAKLTIAGVPDEPGIAARVFRALADAGVNVDMIVQNVSHPDPDSVDVGGPRTDISFTVPKADLGVATQTTERVAHELGFSGVSADPGIARVSVVGAGMKTHPGVAATMFEVLAEHGVNLEMISTSSIRISCVVRAGQVEDAVRALHAAFDLAPPGSDT